MSTRRRSPRLSVGIDAEASFHRRAGLPGLLRRVTVLNLSRVGALIKVAPLAGSVSIGAPRVVRLRLPRPAGGTCEIRGRVVRGEAGEAPEYAVDFISFKARSLEELRRRARRSTAILVDRRRELRREMIRLKSLRQKTRSLAEELIRLARRYQEKVLGVREKFAELGPP